MFVSMLALLFVAAIAIPVVALNDDDPKKQKTETTANAGCAQEKATADVPCDKPCDKATAEAKCEKAGCDKQDHATADSKCSKAAAGTTTTASAE